MKNRMVRAWLKNNSRVRFSDGTTYQLEPSGAMRRMSPQRPWRGKSERRRVLRERRELRLELLRKSLVLATQGPAHA